MNRLEARERAQESDQSLRPAEAFALVGNETRVTILEALWHTEEQPAQFSTLYEMVETQNSSQFNYHLNQLTGHFIRKTEDGYELRTAGESVVQAVIEGSLTAHPSLDTFETGDDCTQCGEPLVASYTDEKLAIDCPECNRAHGEFSFPPGGLLNRERDEILAAFNQRVRHLHCLAKDGVCPACSGQMETAIVREGDCCLDAGLRAEHTCKQCQQSLCSTIGLALLDQSPVVAFYRDHGIDIGTTPYWLLDWCVSDDYTTVLSRDPWRIEVSISLDDETLTVTLDGDLGVVDTTRELASAN